MTLQSALEPRMWQFMPDFMVAMMITLCIHVCFLYFADDQMESRSVLLLCLHHVVSHSIVVT